MYRNFLEQLLPQFLEMYHWQQEKQCDICRNSIAFQCGCSLVSNTDIRKSLDRSRWISLVACSTPGLKLSGLFLMGPQSQNKYRGVFDRIRQSMRKIFSSQLEVAILKSSCRLTSIMFGNKMLHFFCPVSQKTKRLFKIHKRTKYSQNSPRNSPLNFCRMFNKHPSNIVYIVHLLAFCYKTSCV